MSRKYPELNLKEGQYYVYCHTTPDGMYYIGMSRRKLNKRWGPSYYKNTSLESYIQEYGWDNIKHTVLAVVDSKHEAETLEDEIIYALQLNNLNINERRSGGHYRDKDDVFIKAKQEQNKAYKNSHKDELLNYYSEYHKKHLSKRKLHRKKMRSTPEGKIYNTVTSFNQKHPDLAIETPKEARDKYLATGYIPQYIKHDDI